jgi:hypothetical protein
MLKNNIKIIEPFCFKLVSHIGWHLNINIMFSKNNYRHEMETILMLKMKMRKLKLYFSINTNDIFVTRVSKHR